MNETEKKLWYESTAELLSKLSVCNSKWRDWSLPDMPQLATACHSLPGWDGWDGWDHLRPLLAHNEQPSFHHAPDLHPSALLFWSLSRWSCTGTGYWQVTNRLLTGYWQLLTVTEFVDIEGVASPQVIAENSWFCPGVVFRHFVSIEMRWVPENFKPAKFCSDSWTWTPPVISLRRARRNTSFIGTVGAANHPTLLLDLRVNRFWYQCGWYDFCIGMICLSWDSSIPYYHILPCFCNNTCFGADWIIASVDSSDSSCKSVLDRAAFVDLATRKQVGRFQRMNQLVSLKTLDKQFALLLLESTRRANVTSCIQTPHELVQETILKCLALNC